MQTVLRPSMTSTTKWTAPKIVFGIRKKFSSTWIYICFITMSVALNRFRKLLVDLFSHLLFQGWLNFKSWVSWGVSSSWEWCYDSFKSPPKPRIYNTDSLSHKNRGSLNPSAFDRLNLAACLSEMLHKFNSSLPRAVNHRVTRIEIHSTTLDIQNISWASAYGNLIASSGTNWDSLYPDHTGTKWKPLAAKSNICQRFPIRPVCQLWV